MWQAARATCAPPEDQGQHLIVFVGGHDAATATVRDTSGMSTIERLRISPAAGRRVAGARRRTSSATTATAPISDRLLALRGELPEAGLVVSTRSLQDPAGIRAADAFGAAFAVDSHREIDRLERERVTIGRCLHARPAAPVAEITGAYLRGVRLFVIGGPDELANFRELPEVAVLVRLSFGGVRRHDRGVAPRAAARTVRACRAAGIRVAGFTLQLDGVAHRRGRRIRRTVAIMRRLERGGLSAFDTLDLDLGGLDARHEASRARLGRDLHAAVRGAARRYRVVARRAA